MEEGQKFMMKKSVRPTVMNHKTQKVEDEILQEKRLTTNEQNLNLC